MLSALHFEVSLGMYATPKPESKSFKQNGEIMLRHLNAFEIMPTKSVTDRILLVTL